MTAAYTDRRDLSMLLDNEYRGMGKEKRGQNVISRMYEDANSKSQLLNLSKAQEPSFLGLGPNILDNSTHRSMTSFKQPPQLPSTRRSFSKVGKSILGGDYGASFHEKPLPQITNIMNRKDIDRHNQSEMGNYTHRSAIKIAGIDIPKPPPPKLIRHEEAITEERIITEVDEEQEQNKETQKQYLDALLKQVDVMEKKRSEFKQYRPEELHEKDGVFNAQVQEERQINEERRKDIESDLRKIFADKEFSGTDYNPVEGFLFEGDFLLTRSVRFEDISIRYSVYLAGERFSPIFKSEDVISEPYSSDTKRAFIGERQIVEDINPDENIFLIIELINKTNKGGHRAQELIGWTLIQLFNENDDLIQKKWVVPLFRPPTQYYALPNQLVSKLELVEGSKLFIRISHPRNEELNYTIKKRDPLDFDYSSSPFLSPN